MPIIDTSAGRRTFAGGWSYPAFSYSTDLRQWSPAEPAQQITPEDVKAPAVECMIPFNYGNQDLGFPCGMDKPKGVFTVMLACAARPVRLELGEPARDLHPLRSAGKLPRHGPVPLHNEPFVMGDELLIYFNAFSRQQQQPCPFGTRSIGVARLRRDGFAGLQAAVAGVEGGLTTRPLQLTETGCY